MAEKDTKDTKSQAKPAPAKSEQQAPAKSAPRKPSLPAEVKLHVDSVVAEGRMTPHDWRHVALDIADQFEVEFHAVEAYAKKVLGL